MWLSRLDLLAFGHFSNVHLDLGEGFHLVYGRNEAGKSTTLRAIRQLLFGFDERTTDNFFHKNPNLRIGGTIRDSSGTTLQVIRRKTRKESLRGSDDLTVVDEVQWQKMLSGIDEATFSRRYGIDYEQLIKGGHEIATGSGDLGEILFATASGIKDLSAIQKRFVDEAAELFRQKGEKQRINVALNELKKQRDQVNERLILVPEWEEIDRQRQQADAELKDVAQRIERSQTERTQLESWKIAWPHLREQESVKTQLAEFVSLPRLPDDFGAMRQEAAALFDQANALERAANQELAQAQAALQKIEIPEALVAGTDEVTQLLTQWGSYSKAQFDRQGLLEQRNQLNASSKQLRESMGRSVDELEKEGFVLEKARRSQVGQLGRQQAGLIESLQQARQQQQRLRHRIAEVQLELTSIPVVQQQQELRQIVRQARVDGDFDQRQQRLAEEIRDLEVEVDRQRAEIGLWTGPIAPLRTINIPSPAVITEIEKQLDANQSEQSLLRTRMNELEDRHKKLVGQIEVLKHQFQIPTEGELHAARKHRDQIWSELRETVLSGRSPTLDSIESFQQAIVEADRIADRLRSEADRVAQLAEQLNDKVDNENDQHEVSVRLAELEARRIDVEKRWRSAWADLNVAPLAPREMRTWLSRRENLLQSDSLLTRRQNEATAIVERINRHVAALELQVEAANVIETSAPPADTASRLNQRLERAEQLLELNESSRQRRVDAEERLASLKVDERESVALVVKATQEMENWTGAWQRAMNDLKLPPETTVEKASDYLETFGELSDIIRQIEQLTKRINDIEGEGTQFRENVKSLCRQLAPELVESTTDEAVKSLRDLLSKNQRDRELFQEQSTRKEHAEKQLVLAREGRARAAEIVGKLCLAARLTETIEPADFQSANCAAEIFQSLKEIEERSRQRSALEEKIVRSNERLQGLARELPLADFITQIRQHSENDVSDRLRQLESEIPALLQQHKALVGRIAEIQAELKRMDGRSDAAEAEERLQGTLAQIRSYSEQYARARLAGAILHSAIEKYREKNRGPVLTAASELFRELTLQRFEGLRVDEDDRGNPVLIAIRAESGEPVPVEGMSEGTCDQLYLALRLASLEMEVAPRNQLPFIVDDILIQFDDERAAAALKILARLARQRQVIFFTHHEHLLELAGRHLTGGFAVHRLEA